MVKILLCCSAGMSTSMLVRKMENAASNKGLEAQIEAASMEEFHDKLPEYDCCMLGPQIKYKLQDFQQNASLLNKPIAVINAMDYGMLNGEKVLQSALALIEASRGA